MIDGQHRYCAMKQLYDEYNKKDESCNIEIIHVSTLDEVNEYYTIINKNTPLPKCIFTKEEKFSIPIICVGNIYIGGTGKTPISLKVCKIIL